VQYHSCNQEAIKAVVSSNESLAVIIQVAHKHIVKMWKNDENFTVTLSL